MTAAHVPEYEVEPHEPAPAEAIEAAEDGRVVYLTRRGERLAAIVPVEVAPVAEAAVIALEDAADLRAARAAMAEGGEPIPAERLWAELAL